MPTSTYSHEHMTTIGTKSSVAPYAQRQPHDKPTTTTERAHTSLLRGSATPTANAAICRQSQAATADTGDGSEWRSTEALSRAAPAATGCIPQRHAAKLAAEPRHRLRWLVRLRASDAPLMRRRRGGGQRRRGTRRPLNAPCWGCCYNLIPGIRLWLSTRCAELDGWRLPRS